MYGRFTFILVILLCVLLWCFNLTFYYTVRSGKWWHNDGLYCTRSV